jgi:uncharacterized protein
VSAAKPLPRIRDTTRPYWEGAREGRLLLQRCRSCRHAIHYPRAWCPACWATDLEWFEASGRGRVITFTVVHQAPFAAYTADVPYVLAVVGLDEGPQMMANVVGVRPGEVRVDLPVEVTFEERANGVRVPQFRAAVRREEEKA